MLLLYTSSSPTLSPILLSPLPIDSPLSYNIMSQYDLNAIIRQQQEQLAAMQMQIQALLTRGVVVERTAGNGTASIKVVKPQIFDGTSSKVSGFMIACKLYIRIKIREAAVKKQI